MDLACCRDGCGAPPENSRNSLALGRSAPKQAARQGEDRRYGPAPEIKQDCHGFPGQNAGIANFRLNGDTRVQKKSCFLANLRQKPCFLTA